jgi:hypothetical protein
MAVGTAGHRKVAIPSKEKQSLSSASLIDIPLWHGRLLDAGSELLPLVHAIVGLDKDSDEYAAMAGAMWPLLRECWSAWWMLEAVWDRPEAWAEWQRCTGDWSLWQRAGLAGLVKYWLERCEPPYQWTPEEHTALARWLYGTTYERKDRPATAPPFFVTEMLDPAFPF